MNINIEIEKILKKPKFLLSEYEFIIKINSFLKKGTILGSVLAQSNDPSKKIVYKLINKTNFIEINSLTGQLFISNENFLKNILNYDEIQLLIEASYLLNENSFENNLKSFTNVKIYFRSINNLNNISYKIEIQSLFIQQINNLNKYYINENISLNEILFKINLLSSYYLNDKFILLLENSYSTFSLLSSTSLNNFILKNHHYLIPKSIYLLNFKIKHQLTQEYLLSNLTIELIVNNPLISSLNFLQINSNNICLKNLTYFIYDLNNKYQIGKLKVIQTNLNISFFSNFSFLKNKTEILIDQCQMFIENFDFIYLNQTQFELCSIDNLICFNITLINQQFSLFSIKDNKNKNFISKTILLLRPIEITIFAISIVFIMATLTLILIICRLKGFRVCLTIKNYLFYGKKYGINNAQRLSSAKMAVSD